MHFHPRAHSPAFERRLLFGFIAGCLAVLLFHQVVLGVLNAIGFVKAATFSLKATAPFGVPQVISLAFWGGVWGVLFAAVEQHFPRNAFYWVAAFVFGAILPTLVAWFIVAPIKGLPVAAAGDPHRIVTGLLINGAWGVGTAVFLAVCEQVYARWPRSTPLSH